MILPLPKSHDFDESLARSHAASDRPYWRECYVKAFGTTDLVLVDHRKNGDHQRVGIDRSVILPNSKQILIDEKVRDIDYGDIALEEWSDTNTGSPGWIIKELRADYIAYAVEPRGICWLLPVTQLQKAWRLNGELWKDSVRTDPDIRRIPSHSTRKILDKDGNVIGFRNWDSLCWGIKPERLFQAVTAALTIHFTPIPNEENERRKKRYALNQPRS